MRRFGGIEKPYSDLASCQQFCLTKVNCTAVEFDRLDGRPHCYHFSTDKAPNHDKQGLNHYTWRCLPDGGAFCCMVFFSLFLVFIFYFHKYDHLKFIFS